MSAFLVEQFIKSLEERIAILERRADMPVRDGHPLWTPSPAPQPHPPQGACEECRGVCVPRGVPHARGVHSRSINLMPCAGWRVTDPCPAHRGGAK